MAHPIVYLHWCANSFIYFCFFFPLFWIFTPKHLKLLTSSNFMPSTSISTLSSPPNIIIFVFSLLILMFLFFSASFHKWSYILAHFCSLQTLLNHPQTYIPLIECCVESVWGNREKKGERNIRCLSYKFISFENEFITINRSFHTEHSK